VSSKVDTRRRHDIALLLFLYGAMFSWSAHTRVGGVPWFEIGAAVISISVGVGVWYAREWARWACGVLGVLMVARYLAVLAPFKSILGVLRSGADGLFVGVIGIILLILTTLLWAVIAFYCFRRSTRARFSEAREERVRARAAPS
jgi:hypothetical protein